MAWFAVHDTISGALISVGTVVDDAALPPTVAKLALAGEPDFRTQRWNSTLRAFETIPQPTDDDLLLALPRKQRLAPTTAAGKAALKDLLDERVGQAQAWEWFAARVNADAGVPAVAKNAVQALADAEYAEAKRLALAWRQAT